MGFLACFAVACALAATRIICTGRAEIGIVAPRVEFPTLLTSEIRAASGVAGATYEIRNDTDSSRRVTYRGASCGCAGVIAGTRQLKPGDELTLSPGETLT